MTKQTKNVTLFQVNTRVYLRELSEKLKRKATLDDIPEEFFQNLKGKFDYVWFLGVWQTGEQSKKASREFSRTQPEFRKALPDLNEEEDVHSSPFAISNYHLHEDFGGNKETNDDKPLENLKKRLHNNDLKLILDFVPNHTGLDHHWVQTKPQMYIQGNEQLLQEQPHNYIKIGDTILAHGRDPYFDGWTDTLQLNYRHPECRAQIIKTIMSIAQFADGIRCDMAMLILEDVMERVWPANVFIPQDDEFKYIHKDFWPEAVSAVKNEHSDFIFMAEVYWDREWDLQQQGFDYTYDKKLYDRLLQRNVDLLRGHLQADKNFQLHSVRFLENHDEPRAAHDFSDFDQHQAAAIIAFFIPGMRFFYEGQFEGRTFKIPMQLGRRPVEPVNRKISDFYKRLISILSTSIEVKEGEWTLLNCKQAWEGNYTNNNFLSFLWCFYPASQKNSTSFQIILVTVNYADYPGQTYVDLSNLHEKFYERKIIFKDLMHDNIIYERNGDELTHKGLFLDVGAFNYHVFRLTSG